MTFLKNKEIKEGKIGSLRWVKSEDVFDFLSTRYLLADGSEKMRADYPLLYDNYTTFGLYRGYGVIRKSDRFTLPRLTKGLTIYEPAFLYSSDANGRIFKVYTEDWKGGAKAMTRVGEENIFRGHTDVVRSICVSSPDGKFLYSGSMSGTVYKVDTKTMTQVGMIGGLANSVPVKAMVISSDGTYLYITSESFDADNTLNYEIHKIDTRTMERARDVNGNLIPAFVSVDSEVEITALAIVEGDDNFLYSGNQNGKVYKIDTNTMTQAKGLDGTTVIPAFEVDEMVSNVVALVAMKDNDNTYVYCALNITNNLSLVYGYVYKVDGSSMTRAKESDGNTEVPRFDGQSFWGSLHALTIHKEMDNTFLYTGGNYGKVFKVDTNTMTFPNGSDEGPTKDKFEVNNSDERSTIVHSLTVSSDQDGIFLYTGDSLGFIFKVDTKTMKSAKSDDTDLVFVGHAKSSTSSSVFALASSPYKYDTFLYSGGSDRDVFKIDTRTMKQVSPIESDGVFEGHSGVKVRKIVISMEGDVLYSGGDDGRVFKIKTNSMTQYKDDLTEGLFDGFGASSHVLSLALTKDNSFLYAGSLDGKLYKLDTTSMTIAKDEENVDLTFVDHVNHVYSLVLSDDEAYIFAGYHNGKVIKIKTIDMTQYSDADTNGEYDFGGENHVYRLLFLKEEKEVFGDEGMEIEYNDVLYTATRNGDVVKIDIKTMSIALDVDGNEMRFVGHGSDPVNDIIASHDSRYLYSCGTNGNVFKIDRLTMKVAKDVDGRDLKFDGNGSSYVFSLELSEDDIFLYSVAEDGKVFKIETESMRVAKDFEGHDLRFDGHGSSDVWGSALSLPRKIGNGEPYDIYPLILAK